MPRPESRPRSPDHFASLLATEKPVLLVGGQAVNLWALYYKDRTSDLAPFVSRDADVLGDRELLTELGRVVGVKPQFFPFRPPTNEVGVVIAKDAEGLPLLIEVLRTVRGATNSELRDPAYTVAVGEKSVLVQIPGPVALLKAKIANVTEINQSGRQDARHVVVLARVMPGYLKELGSKVASGALKERAMLDVMEDLLAVVTTKPARKVFKELRLEVRSLFAGIADEKLPKVTTFLEHRLPRLLQR